MARKAFTAAFTAALVVLLVGVKAQAPDQQGLFAPRLSNLPQTASEVSLNDIPDEVDPNDVEPTVSGDSAVSPELAAEVPAANPCPPEVLEFPSIDGVCNNLKHINWGAANTPQVPEGSDGAGMVGEDRPNPRFISNTVSDQKKDIFNKRKLSEFLVHFGQFIDHCIVATPSTNPKQTISIAVPDDDEQFRMRNGNDSTMLPFVRSARATHRNGKSAPLNGLTSFLHLAAVYGATVERTNALRSFKDGKLATSAGNMPPRNTIGANNAPNPSADFYIFGDHRGNEHPGLFAIHVLFLREHNRLCEVLKSKFPEWGDERLFQMARKISINTFQKIVAEEFYPAVTGRRMNKYNGYNEEVDTTVTAAFTTAGYRICHDMVGPKVNRLASGNSPMPPFELSEVFFRTASVFASNTIDVFLRGLVKTTAQEIDGKAVDVLRNHLFLTVPEEEGFDLITLNIQRGRDHRIPTLNEMRKILGLEPAFSFFSHARNFDTAKKLMAAYGTKKSSGLDKPEAGDGGGIPGMAGLTMDLPDSSFTSADTAGMDKIDLWIGIATERQLYGLLGETGFRLWEREFERMRNGDRFWYERPNLFSTKVLAAIKENGGQTMRELLLRNSDVSPSEVSDVWRT